MILIFSSAFFELVKKLNKRKAIERNKIAQMIHIKKWLELLPVKLSTKKGSIIAKQEINTI